MYMGHIAVGLAAKRFAPEVPITALTIAPVTADLGAGVLNVLGLDPHQSWTHTLPAAAGWTLAVGVFGAAWRGSRTGLLLGALAATHLPLDYVTGTLPLWRNGPSVGLFLCRYPFADYGVEVGMSLVAWFLYVGTLPEGAPRRWLAVLIFPMMAALQVVFSFVLSA